MPEGGQESEEPAGVVPIEEAIDLHGFQPRDIPSVVEAYLLEAQARGFREVCTLSAWRRGRSPARGPSLTSTFQFGMCTRETPSLGPHIAAGRYSAQRSSQTT